MRRLTLNDLTKSGLTDVEALILYLTQNRNETEAALAEVKAGGLGDVASLEQHLARVEKQLTEATVHLRLPDPISDTESPT